MSCNLPTAFFKKQKIPKTLTEYIRGNKKKEKTWDLARDKDVHPLLPIFKVPSVDQMRQPESYELRTH